tara:strand:- start:193 stop:663 length:471 start_codon:yes stop_codon:yes gene_type:complete
LLRRLSLGLLASAISVASLPAIAQEDGSADDFVYLKCSGTIKNTVFDWNETKELNHWESNAEILYKIDTKNEELFVSSKPEIAIQYELQHPGFIGWTEQVSEGKISGENSGYLQYDPPGKDYGAMYHSDMIRRLKYFGSVDGSCEASDASAYEASK